MKNSNENKEIEISFMNITPSEIFISKESGVIKVKVLFKENEETLVVLEEKTEENSSENNENHNIRYDENRDLLMTKEGFVLQGIDSTVCFPSILEILDMSESDKIKITSRVVNKCLEKISG